MPDRARVDPVGGAIVERMIKNAAREMGLTLLRSTRSPVLFEARDFATGIFDAAGRVLEQHQYLPLMAFCLGPVVDEVIRRSGTSASPGDVFIHNEGYRGGTHAMDVAIVRPIFDAAGRTLLGWAACKGHMLDWGGPVPSGYNSEARTTWDEPLRVPALRLYHAGVRNEELHDLIAANIRVPEIVLHDVEAMVGAAAVGERRIQEIVERSGLPTFQALIDRWIATTEAKTRSFIEGIPDGRYAGRSRVQYRHGEWADICLTVTIDGTTVIADFDGTSPQTDSFVNAPFTVTRGGVLQCLAMMLRGAIDLNAGFAAPIDVRIPSGTMLNARYPAPVGYCLHLTDQITEAFFRALAPVRPDAVVAGWLQWGTTVSGRYAGRDFTTPLFFASKGGGGATQGADGYDYIGSVRMSGALEAEDVEMFELVHRWATVRHLSYWPGSGGRGQWRGGLGSYAEVVLGGEDMEIAVFGTGRDEGASGILGGSPSPRGRLMLEYPDGRVLDVESHANVRSVPSGTVLRKWNTGGGGVGPPSARTAEATARDALEGYDTGEEALTVKPPYLQATRTDGAALRRKETAG